MTRHPSLCISNISLIVHLLLHHILFQCCLWKQVCLSLKLSNIRIGLQSNLPTAKPDSQLNSCHCVSMSQIMQHHGCRSHMRDRNKLTGLEERFDLVVDSNDVILERVVWPASLTLMQISSWKSLCKPTELLYLISRGFFLMKLMGWTGASSLSCLQAFSLPRLLFPAGIARLAN